MNKAIQATQKEFYSTEYLSGIYEKISDDTEVAIVLFLNDDAQVIERLEFTGSPNDCVINIIEIVKIALLNKAFGIILAHNHPSDDDEPSISDFVATLKTILLIESLDITLLDHIVLTNRGNNARSLFENDYFKNQSEFLFNRIENMMMEIAYKSSLSS